ncbi:hypothetical protein [Bacillus sp. JCM 19041]|uniref:hypothetical protein n=1 Tax=Bacillus sp. JCM 19041 TaxID=1460637 RepID=UPI0006D23094
MNEPTLSRVKQNEAIKEELPARANHHKNKRTKKKRIQMVTLPQVLFSLFFMLVIFVLLLAFVFMF